MIKFNQVLYTVEIESKGLLAVEQFVKANNPNTYYTNTVAEAVLYEDRATADSIVEEINENTDDVAVVREVYIRIE